MSKIDSYGQLLGQIISDKNCLESDGERLDNEIARLRESRERIKDQLEVLDRMLEYVRNKMQGDNYEIQESHESLSQQVKSFFEREPERYFSPGQVIDALGLRDRKASVRATLNNLFNSNFLKREKKNENTFLYAKN